MKENTFLDIIKKSQKGDNSAQTQLYQAFYRSMFNTCFRILNDYAEAEDVMQESFIIAFNELGKFKGETEASFGSWIKKIIVNRSIDAVRKRKGFYVELEKTKVHEQMDEAYSEYGISSDTVNAAIQQLPDKYRTILSLYLLEGFDHEEISEIMHISNNNSRTTFHRAKELLKKIIKEMQPEFSLN